MGEITRKLWGKKRTAPSSPLQHPSAEGFNVYEVVNKLRDHLNQILVRRNISLDITVQDQLPQQFSGDSGQFQRLLIERANAAISLVENGEVELHITGGSGPTNDTSMDSHPPSPWTDIGIQVRVRGALPDTVLRIPTLSDPPKAPSKNSPTPSITKQTPEALASDKTDLLIVDSDASAGRSLAKALSLHGKLAVCAGSAEVAEARIASRCFRMLLIDLSTPNIQPLLQSAKQHGLSIFGIRHVETSVSIPPEIDGWLEKPVAADIVIELLDQDVIFPATRLAA